MRAIYNAIYNVFLGDADLKVALPGGLHFLIAKQDSRGDPTVYPYATYFPITQTSRKHTFSNDVESILFQITVVGDSYEHMVVAFAAFVGGRSPQRGFDYAVISVDGFEDAKLERQPATYQHDSENNKWRLIITYRLDLEKIDTVRT